MADAKKDAGLKKLSPVGQNAPRPPDEPRKSSGGSGKSDPSSVPLDQQPASSGDNVNNATQVNIEGETEGPRPTHARRNSLLVSLAQAIVVRGHRLENLESEDEELEELEEKKPQEILGIFSRRSVFFCKVYTFLVLYVLSLGGLIGLYAFLSSLSRADHTYGIVTSLEIFDRRPDFNQYCGRNLKTLSKQQQRQEAGPRYKSTSRYCQYDLPHSTALAFLFAINILTILFILIMVLCRRYPRCYRRPIVIYIWLTLIHWRVAVYYNLGVLAVIAAKFLEKINGLTERMIRDMELLVANTNVYSGFWDNTQIQGQCCGIYGKSSSGDEWDNPYPHSCCEKNLSSSFKCTKELAWDIGCRDRQGVVLGIIAGTGITLLFLILFVTCNLMRILDNHGDSWGMNLLHWGLSHEPSPTASTVTLRHLKISTSGRILIEGWSDRSMKIIVLNYQKEFKFTSVRHTDLITYSCKTPNRIVVGYIQVEMLMTAPSKSNLSTVRFANNDQGIVVITF